VNRKIPSKKPSKLLEFLNKKDKSSCWRLICPLFAMPANLNVFASSAVHLHAFF
jgi:hypothetical protein